MDDDNDTDQGFNLDVFYGASEPGGERDFVTTKIEQFILIEDDEGYITFSPSYVDHDKRQTVSLGKHYMLDMKTAGQLRDALTRCMLSILDSHPAMQTVEPRQFGIDFVSDVREAAGMISHTAKSTKH